MSRNRGVVLEVRSREAVVLVGGAFRRVPVSSTVRVGDEIVMPPGTGIIRLPGGYQLPAYQLVAGLILLLALPLLVFMQPAAEAVAVVQIDHGDLFELTLDRRGRVLDLSVSGEPPAAGTPDLEGLSLTEVLNLLLAEPGALEQGTDRADLLIGVTPTRGGSDLPDTVRTEIRKAGQEATDVMVGQGRGRAVTVVVDDPGAWDEAGERGISVPRLIIQTLTLADGHQVDEEEFKQPGLSRALERHGVNLDSLVPAGSEIKNFGQLMKRVKDTHKNNRDGFRDDANVPGGGRAAVGNPTRVAEAASSGRRPAQAGGAAGAGEARPGSTVRAGQDRSNPFARADRYRPGGYPGTPRGAGIGKGKGEGSAPQVGGREKDHSIDRSRRHGARNARGPRRGRPAR